MGKISEGPLYFKNYFLWSMLFCGPFFCGRKETATNAVLFSQLADFLSVFHLFIYLFLIVFTFYWFWRKGKPLPSTATNVSIRMLEMV